MIRRSLLFLEFLLTGGARAAACVSASTIFWWVYLTDYYHTGWNSDWEYLFFLPAVGLPAALSVLIGWLHSRAARISPLAFPSDMRVPVEVWIAMLVKCARSEPVPPSRGFLRWQARLLSRYAAPGLELCFHKTPWVWRRRRCHLAALCWFPALLGFLCTSWACDGMVAIAKVASPPQVKRITIASAKLPKPVDLIWRDDGKAFYVPTPNGYPKGWVTVYAADFPRVRRWLQVICSGATPGCDVAAEGHGQMGGAAWRRLRGGEATVDFERTAGSLDLGMNVIVFERDQRSVVKEERAH